jgi:hypothetical protein
LDSNRPSVRHLASRFLPEGPRSLGKAIVRHRLAGDNPERPTGWRHRYALIGHAWRADIWRRDPVAKTIVNDAEPAGASSLGGGAPVTLSTTDRGTSACTRTRRLLLLAQTRRRWKMVRRRYGSSAQHSPHICQSHGDTNSRTPRYGALVMASMPPLERISTTAVLSQASLSSDCRKARFRLTRKNARLQT